MLIKRTKPWQLPEQAATPESIYLNRRAVLTAMGVGGATIAVGARPARAQSLFDRLFGESEADFDAGVADDPTADLYPVARNETYTVERALTPEKIVATYNNFYEFGSHKRIFKAAQALPIRPWQVKIDGLVENEQTLDIDALIRRMPLEERLYRHRCVEAWSITVPWSGFAMAELVKLAKPLGSAKYVEMQTFLDPDVASGQRQSWYPWPYTEGLTIDEATNDLAFLVTGMYGHPVTKQDGAPLRLATPWKYGFKSIKSIVRFTFQEERPKTFWSEIAGNEYGFWANVNPDVPHPRWSQATERIVGTDEEVPTRIYNGYGEFVADLYADKKGEQLFM